MGPRNQAQADRLAADLAEAHSDTSDDDVDSQLLEGANGDHVIDVAHLGTSSVECVDRSDASRKLFNLAKLDR